MRALILALCATLTVSGCGKQETGNTASVDEEFTAEDVITNDATAIDAAMGADANMAADVDLNFGIEGPDNNSVSSNGSADSRARSRPSPARPSAEANASDTGNEVEETDEVDSNSL